MKIIDIIIKSVSDFERYLSTHMFLLFCIVAVLFLISVFIGQENNKKLLILYMAVVVYMTLLNRDMSSRRVVMKPFWSYQFLLSDAYLRREILNNIILFIPLGTIFSQIRNQWSTVLVPVLILIGIEILQYITLRGLLEIDDVISNSLGALVGFIAGMLWLQVSRLIKTINNTRKTG